MRANKLKEMFAREKVALGGCKARGLLDLPVGCSMAARTTLLMPTTPY